MNALITAALHARRRMRVVPLLGMLAMLAGCGGGADPVLGKAYTEHDFAADPSLRMKTDAVGVTFLEPKDAQPGAFSDTHSPGVDRIPHSITERTTHTYGIDPTDDTIESAKLIRLPGQEEIFAINRAQPSATVTLEPAHYELILYSGYTVAQANAAPHRVVFLHSGAPTPALADPSPVQLLLSSGAPTPALADPSPVQLLLSTRSCPKCVLTDANLRGVHLTGADLTGARLESANLTGAHLESAHLTDVRLNHAEMFQVRLNNAHVDGSDLTGANMQQAILTGAGFSRSRLNFVVFGGAYMAHADLFEADLEGADLTAATLDSAVWVDGRICAAGSYGSCQ